MKTLVIGASENSSRYSNMVMRLLNNDKGSVIGIGRSEGIVGDSEIITGQPEIPDVHTVTMYVSEKYQPEYEEYVLETIRPKRIIFNPGAENWPFYKKAQAQGIEVMNACTIVMIKTDQYFDVN